MAKKWTESDIDTLRTMYIAGMTYTEIARILGRSSAACQQRAYQMGLPKMRKKLQQQNVSATLTSQAVSREEAQPEPTTWIGRVKRLLGIGG